MKERITEITSASITSPGLPNSTDDIAFRYENRLNKSIIRKILSYQNGIEVTFSPEEIAYLKKSEAAETAMSEIKVITPDPTITLKKGDTEINIKNAATLVRKMDEVYPKGTSNERSENVDFVPAGISIVSPQETKSINKNAYEIRESIIQKSIDIINSSTDISKVDVNVTVDNILRVAEKLYEFVENKKRNKS